MFFPSKILLFGEYAIIKGGEALALPLPLFGGKWAFESDRKKQQDLSKLLAYLHQFGQSGTLLAPLDLAQFESELSEGLYFESDIPAGYGAGSSGALVAAILARFGDKNKLEKTSLEALKKMLGQIESYFHGASSGIDPLVCYLQKSLFIGEGGNLKTVNPPESGQFFLLDTGQSRQTVPLVQWFLEKCKNPDFEKMLAADLMHRNAEAIAAFLSGQRDILWQAFHEISLFQFRHFEKMILPAQRDLWLEGLQGGDFKLKLCGAGGGGFVLGIAKKSDLPVLAGQKIYPLSF
ncbi:MAG TPA: mevalonate kinase [Saprospiraceae bacterium]|nr:mevalonate kinase [Saprospiraceae bacterium]